MIMTRVLIFILTNLISIALLGQPIKLTQAKSPDDLQVINGQYFLYFKRADIISAVSSIDKILKTDNSDIAKLLADKKLKSIDINSKLTSDKPLIDLIKSNLGSYLIIRGKVSLYNGAKPIQLIVADESPEMRGLNGSAKISIFFSEEGLDKQVFLGEMSTKLKMTNNN
jgi:hypothetical protein